MDPRAWRPLISHARRDVISNPEKRFHEQRYDYDFSANAIFVFLCSSNKL